MIWNPFKQKHATVGWVIDKRQAGVIWYPPEEIPLVEQTSPFASTVMGQNLNNTLARHFLMRCPYDLSVSFGRTSDGSWGIRRHEGNAYAVATNKLNQIIHITPEKQWRHPERPLVQIGTPYRFMADERVYIAQLPPFQFHLQNQWPGVFVAGRFPVDVWPRIFMWAIEIHDLSRPLVLKRGDPWFVARFESTRPQYPIKIVEVEPTAEMIDYFTQVDGVTSFVTQTFSLFKTAWKRRPTKLVVPRKF